MRAYTGASSWAGLSGAFYEVTKMQQTTPITITLKMTRETKNTYRYDAIDEDAPVGNIYIQKKALPGGAPSQLELQLTAQQP